MKKVQHMILTLTLVGVISGGALVGVFAYTAPLIEQNQQAALERAVIEVLPGATSFRTRTVDGRNVYEGLGSAGETVGYAFVGEGAGYQGTIQLMIGVDPQFQQTLGIQVLESVETPGLGQKISTQSFRSQFERLRISPAVTLTKKEATGNNEVQAITGATISSQAVVDMVNKAVAEVENLIGA